MCSEESRTTRLQRVAPGRPPGAKEALMANPFVHVELHTGDVGKAKAFYSKLFGWKLKDMPMPGGDNYTMIEVGEGTGGGMMKAQPPGSPPRWQAYVGRRRRCRVHAQSKGAGRDGHDG